MITCVKTEKHLVMSVTIKISKSEAVIKVTIEKTAITMAIVTTTTKVITTNTKEVMHNTIMTQ